LPSIRSSLISAAFTHCSFDNLSNIHHHHRPPATS
jgi:hypothetical protein